MRERTANDFLAVSLCRIIFIQAFKTHPNVSAERDGLGRDGGIDGWEAVSTDTVRGMFNRDEEICESEIEIEIESAQ